MADSNSSKPIPERWMEVFEEKKDGTILLYYSCPESGQRFYKYEDLIRYVNYAKAAKLSIYSPDFHPIGQRKSKNKDGTLDLDLGEESSDSEDSTFELPSITPLELMEMTSPGPSDKQSVSGKMKPRNQASDDGSSSSKGKSKKQKQ